MKEYTIDFNGVRTYYEFFERIIAGLEFPDWCGKNLDAIWDLLTSDIIIPAVIYVKGSETADKALIPLVAEITELLYEAAEWYRDIDCILEIKIIN